MKREFINEVSRMKDLFGYKRGVVISEQFSMGTSSQEKITPNAAPAAAPAAASTYEWADCIIKTASPDEKIQKGDTNVVKNFTDGKTRFNFNKDGSWMFIEVGAGPGVYKMTGKWACNLPPKPFGFTITANDGNQYDSETNKWLDSPNSAAPAAKQVKQPTQWTAEPATLDDDKNTLKKQMTGEKVKQLQTGLDIKGRGGKSLVTGKFWTLTDTKIKQLYPTEYTTQKGVTKTLFDKIVNQTLKASTAAAPTTIPLTGTTAAPVAPVAPVAPQLVAPVTPNLSLAATTTPAAYYKTLYDAGLIQGEGNNKVRYRGPELNKEQQELLTQQMNTLGYDFNRKGNDNRLVYTKR